MSDIRDRMFRVLAATDKAKYDDSTLLDKLVEASRPDPLERDLHEFFSLGADDRREFERCRTFLHRAESMIPDVDDLETALRPGDPLADEAGTISLLDAVRVAITLADLAREFMNRAHIGNERERGEIRHARSQASNVLWWLTQPRQPCAREPRSCDTCDLDGAEENLRDAAREFGAMDQQIGMYADNDKRMDAETIEERNNTRANLRENAFALAVAELETQYPPSDRIPPGHVGDEPSVYEAIDHLKRKSDPMSALLKGKS